MSFKENVKETVYMVLGVAIASACIVAVNRSNALVTQGTGFVEKQETVAIGMPGSNTKEVVSKTYYYDLETREMVKVQR